MSVPVPAIGRFASTGFPDRSVSIPLMRPWSPKTMLFPVPASIVSPPRPPNTKSFRVPVVIESAPPKPSNHDHTSSSEYGDGSPG